MTSSAGRLFDGVASLLGLCQINAYEGQAAMALEQCAASANTALCYDYSLSDTTPRIIDWRVCLTQLLADINHHPTAFIAAKFHNTLAAIMVEIAQHAEQNTVVLSGGCFQNAYLVSKSVTQLKQAGFTVYTHQQIPPNDGGLALGQLYAASFIK